jgi:hypothetical protein
MANENTKYINQLVNAHKVSSILVPLVEALEINKHTEAIPGLNLEDMFSNVVDTSGEIYQELLDRDAKLIDTGLVSDKLMITLAKALRNNLVLYNSNSLSLIKDELLGVFEKNIEFIQNYQNPLQSRLFKDSDRAEEQFLLGYAVSAVAEVFMPVCLFHTSLYSSNLVDEHKLSELNIEVMDYLLSVMNAVLEKVNSAHGEYSEDFKISSLHVCAGITANVIHDFSGKLIKNKSKLEEYIQSPTQVISKLTPAIYSNFSAMSGMVNNAIKSIIKT